MSSRTHIAITQDNAGKYTYHCITVLGNHTGESNYVTLKSHLLGRHGFGS